MNGICNYNLIRKFCLILVVLVLIVGVGFFTVCLATETTEVPESVKTVVEEIAPTLDEEENKVIEESEVPLSGAEIESPFTNLVLVSLGVFVLLLGVVMMIGNRELNREN